MIRVLVNTKCIQMIALVHICQIILIVLIWDSIAIATALLLRRREGIQIIKLMDVFTVVDLVIPDNVVNYVLIGLHMVVNEQLSRNNAPMSSSMKTRHY